jgi:hypothetical protein
VRDHSRSPAADVAVYTGIIETIGEGRIEEDVVEPQPSITLPSFSHVVPEGIHRLGRTGPRPPALREDSVICRAALRLKQRVRVPGSGRINVLTGGYDVVVACQHDRDARFVKLVCVRGEAFESACM